MLNRKKVDLVHKPKKISIRSTILSIVFPIVAFMFAVIIGISYIALHSALITTAHDSLSSSCYKVGEQISNYLRPLNNNSAIAFHLLKNDTIELKHSFNFTKFLYSIIVNDKDIHGAFWGDIYGNFYWLRKTNQDTLYEQIISRNSNGDYTHVENTFDNKLQLLHTKRLPLDIIDPRLRPWYIRAKSKQQLTWTIYKFIKETGVGTPLGITASFPLYDNNNNLIGVFGMDMLLENILKYVHNIKVTPNSVVFVADNIDNLISVHNTDEHLFENYEFTKIDDLRKPWLKKSFDIFQTTHKPSFVFSVDNKEYISAYAKVNDTKSDNPWFVAVVTPMSDINSPLYKAISLALIAACIALILGAILLSIFSSKLSKPIKTLAKNAYLICHMRLDEVKKITSRIAEIIEVDESFMKMKHALGSFQLYLPPKVVKQIVSSNKVASVGGETKELTLIVTDIQNFTRLSEEIDPEKLMWFLSRYFQAVAKVVHDLHGTIDKYMGDGVIAFWTTPSNNLDHAIHACLAALKIQQILKQLNIEWQLENNLQVSTRIGINTGSALVGNIGSEDRLNYTLIGDTVNLASRLEGLNKIYGTNTIISEFTYNKVKDNVKCRLLDKVAVKGKTIGSYIYELLWEKPKEPDIHFEQYNQEFLAAFNHYEHGDWQKAINFFNELDSKYPGDALIKLFIKRCLMFQKKPPSHWDGVWVINEKF